MKSSDDTSKVQLQLDDEISEIKPLLAMFEDNIKLMKNMYIELAKLQNNIYEMKAFLAKNDTADPTSASKEESYLKIHSEILQKAEQMQKEYIETRIRIEKELAELVTNLISPLNSFDYAELISDPLAPLDDKASPAHRKIHKLLMLNYTHDFFTTMVVPALKEALIAQWSFKDFTNLPPEILRGPLSGQLDLTTSSKIRQTSTTMYTLFDENQANYLLKLVKKSNYEGVIKIVTADPQIMFRLAHYDQSDGSYKMMSPLQFAIQQLDSPMYYMFRNIIKDNPQLKEQYDKQFTEQTEHINIDELLNSFDALKINGASQETLLKVGKAQSKLPENLLNEFKCPNSWHLYLSNNNKPPQERFKIQLRSQPNNPFFSETDISSMPYIYLKAGQKFEWSNVGTQYTLWVVYDEDQELQKCLLIDDLKEIILDDDNINKMKNFFSNLFKARLNDYDNMRKEVGLSSKNTNEIKPDTF